MSFWDKVINQNKIDSSLITELSDLSYRSIGGKRQATRGAKEDIVNIGTIPFETTPPPDKITKDMILEFQKSKDKPYIDPTTGTEYKYFPSTMVFDATNLQAPALVNDAHLGRPARETDILALKQRLERFSVVDLPVLRRRLENRKDKLKKVNDLINSGTLHTRALGNARAEKIRYETDIAQYERDIATLIGNIDATKTHIENAKQNIQENKQIVIATDKLNKDNLMKYKETLQAVNRDRLNNLEREPNESDADYLQRMKNTEAEVYDTNLHKEKAHLEQIGKLKINLKKIIRKDELIDNVVKSFTGEQIFVINKNFTGIKEYFLENFGFNNANLTTNDIVDEITNILSRILNPPSTLEIEGDIALPPSTGEPYPVDRLKDASGADTEFIFGTENNALFIKNEINDTSIYLKIGKKAKNVVFFSTSSNAKGSFVAIRERGEPKEETIRWLLFGKDYIAMDNYAKTQILDGAKTIDDLYEILLNKYLLQPITDIKTTKLSPTKIKYGWGISHPDEEIPINAQFGNLIILLNKLFYKNILSLKTKSGHNIDGLKNTKVSDTFVEIIMKLYYNEDVSNLIKNLSTIETQLYNSILYMAGLHKKYGSNPNETIGTLKQKFKVCEGELLSGNNNPEIIKELKDILMKLYHLNAISISSIKKYLKQFNSN